MNKQAMQEMQAKISGISSAINCFDRDTITYRLYAFGDFDMQVDYDVPAMDVASWGSLGEWLVNEALLSEEDADFILSRDFEVVGTDGEIVTNVFKFCGESLEMLDDAYTIAHDTLSEQIVSAGLQCGFYLDAIEDHFQGYYDDPEDFVREITLDCHEIPEWLEGYVNWEKMTREIMHDYYHVDGCIFRC